MQKEKVDLLKRLLVDEEGYNPHAHQVKGVWHIGYGHCLDQEQSDEELEVMGLDDELDDWDGFELSDAQCDSLFEIDVADALSDAEMIFSPEQLEGLSPARWAVVMSMLFQMGAGGVRKFKSFITAVIGSDWDRASDEMLWSNGLRKKKRSAWYKQTPERCQEAADAMRVGYFDQYQKSPAEAIADVGSALASAAKGGDAMPYHTKLIKIDEMQDYLASKVAQGYVLSEIAITTETVQDVLVVTEYDPDKAKKLIKT